MEVTLDMDVIMPSQARHCKNIYTDIISPYRPKPSAFSLLVSTMENMKLMIDVIIFEHTTINEFLKKLSTFIKTPVICPLLKTIQSKGFLC